MEEENRVIASAQQPTGIRAYFAELAKYPPLRMEQEAELARRIAAGAKKHATDEERAEAKAAKDRLVLSNARLVASIATEYLGRGLSYDDLVCEGNLGLIRAAETFDADAGFKFGTYAGYWIRERIGEALCNDGRSIRIPVNAVQGIGTVMKASAALTQRLGREPTEEEVAAELGDDPIKDRVHELLRLIAEGQGCAMSLDRTIGENKDIALVDLVGTPDDAADGIDAEDRRNAVRKALSRLDPRDRRVIELHYGFDGHGFKTYEQVALAMADEGYVSPVDGEPLTRQRVQQLETEILKRLRFNRGLMEVR